MGTDAYFRKKERRIASWPCESGLRYTRKLTEKPRPFWGVGRLITWPSGNILHVLSCTSEWTATGLCKCTCCLRSDSKHCSIWNLTLDVHMRERELFFLIHLLPSLAAVLSRPLMLNREVFNTLFANACFSLQRTARDGSNSAEHQWEPWTKESYEWLAMFAQFDWGSERRSAGWLPDHCSPLVQSILVWLSSSWAVSSCSLSSSSPSSSSSSSSSDSSCDLVFHFV